MAFDMGFNFRDTAGFVTDPAYGVPVLKETYPHTYTNGNGQSINAGWSHDPPSGSIDRSNTNDARIAGINYKNNGAQLDFKVDLSSGSAPGAGNYTVDCAIGDQAGTWTQDFKILDNATVLVDGTNGSAGIATVAGEFVDATLTNVTASTTWTGTPVSKTFATTTAILGVCYDAVAGYTTVAHFRLTLATAGSAATRSMLMLLGVGV